MRLIDADAFEEVLIEAQSKCKSNFQYGFLSTVRENLRKMPTIKQMILKTGHWQVLTMCANEGAYCSECHTKIFDFVHPPKKKLSQYCPHCGVKMDEHYDPWEDA